MSGKAWLLVGLVMSAVGVQLATATHGWHEVLTPGFVAGILINVAAVIIARYQDPPGGGGSDMTVKNVPKVLLVLALAGTLFSACGATAKHKMVVADTALYETLNLVHQSEQQVLCGQPSCAGVAARVTPAWTDAKSQAFNKSLLPAVDAGRQFNTLLAQMKPGDPMPDQMRRLIQSLSASLAQVLSDLPDGATKSAVLANLGKAQAIVLGALDVAMTVKGAK